MTVRIPTRSKRQAMDWSLALLSQGIESIIDRSEEFSWGLLVAEEQHAASLKIIEQYQAENLHWPWRQKIPRQEMLFDWGSAAWVVIIGLFFWLSARSSAFTDAGLMDSAAVSNGQWWRFFTAIFLHADISHLVANAGIGFALLGLTMGRYGTGIGILAAYLAGVGGNVATWLTLTNHRSLGASGMVMGCVGLLTAQALSLGPNRRAAWKYTFTGFAGGLMLFALVGLSPGTDVLAHFGGFVSGILIGILLLFVLRVTKNHSANLLGGIVFSLLTILPWWFALRK